MDDGFDVEVASGGAEALRKLKYLRPQVILLDLRMPGLSGLHVLREMQANNVTGRGLNIMITAYGETDAIREAKVMGVKGCISKPFDLVELRYMVKAVIAGAPMDQVGNRAQMLDESLAVLTVEASGGTGDGCHICHTDTSSADIRYPIGLSVMGGQNNSGGRAGLG